MKGVLCIKFLSFLDFFFWHSERFVNSELSAFLDDNVLHWLVANSFRVLDLTYDVHAFQDLSKNGVLAIQPRRYDSANEELTSVCIFACIGHAKPSSTIMIELEILVGKSFSIDALTTHAVAGGEVAALNHEILDDAMEFRALITIAFLACAQVDEILDRTRYGLTEQAEHDATNVLASDGNIEEHFLIHHGFNVICCFTKRNECNQ